MQCYFRLGRKSNLLGNARRLAAGPIPGPAFGQIQPRAHRRGKVRRGRPFELERSAAELDERGTWLTDAVARVEARERDVADRERHVVAAESRFARTEQDLDLRKAALDDRDRRLTQAEEALAERRRQIRDEELRLQTGEPA